MTLALLYLSRTHSKRQDVKKNVVLSTSEGSGYCNPLISSTDNPNNYFFEHSHRLEGDDDDSAEGGDTSMMVGGEYGGVEGLDHSLSYSHSQGHMAKNLPTVPSSKGRTPKHPQQLRPYAINRNGSSFDSNNVSVNGGGVRRLNSGTVYGGDSDAALSGHTEQLFAVGADLENEQMFGAVYSPDNSISYLYRDTALFSPAMSTISRGDGKPT